MRKNAKFILMSFLLLLMCYIPGCTGYAEMKEFSVPSPSYSMGDEYKGVLPYSSVVRMDGKSRCTGTVVGKDYVITASHCSGADRTVTVYLSPKLEKTFYIDKPNSTYNHHSSGAVIDDYALVKINPLSNIDGSLLHIGDIVKPLTIVPDTANKTFWKGSELAVLGFPSWSNNYQEYGNFYATSVNASKIHGNMKKGGGLSGGPLLNNNAQVLGIYHGSGSFAAMNESTLVNDLMKWGLSSETSRIYIWKDKEKWSEKREEILPIGRNIEKRNGEKVSLKELKSLAAKTHPEGYHASFLTDSINEFNSDFQMPIGGLNLYPSSIEKNSYKVVYNSNTENGGVGMADQSFEFDEAQKLTQNTYTRENSSFNGWNTEKDGSGQHYSDGEDVKNLTNEDDGIVTLYAQWKTNTSSIRIHYIEEESGKPIAPDSVEYGDIGSSYILGAPSHIDDYELNPESFPGKMEGNFSDSSSEVTFYYKKITNTNPENSTITIRYLSNTLNSKIIPNAQIVDKKGRAYAIAPAKIDGYQFVSCGTNNFSGVLTENNITIDFYYERVSSSISGSDFTMHVGDPVPTVSNFKAQAWDINYSPLSIDILFENGVDFNSPGKYKVKLKAEDGQIKSVFLIIKENLQQISGSDFTMYMGDPVPKASDFKASALSKDGEEIQPYLDLNKADLERPGVYSVYLRTNDGQEKKVNLYVIDYDVGDINKDKLINIKDVSCLKKYLNNPEENDIKDILKVGDLNKDGQVNIMDYSLLINLINKK